MNLQLVATEWLLPMAQALPVVIESPGYLDVSALVRHLIAALAFSLLGVIILAVSVWVLSHVLPFSMRKELEEDQNVALGIILGALILGISLIIAAAMLG